MSGIQPVRAPPSFPVKLAKLKSTLNPKRFRNIQQFIRREDFLKKLELEEAGGSTLATLKKKEIINQIRKENQKLVYD